MVQSGVADGDKPLDLSDLRPWVSEEVFSWLQEAEEEEETFQKEMANCATHQLSNLFATNNDVCDEDKVAVEDGRVQKWSTSTTNPDGILGGAVVSAEEQTEVNQRTILYLESNISQGHGDMLWASARHIANRLANPKDCQELLSPLLATRKASKSPADSDHPLQNRRFLELGAGCGVPSWTALQCGALVVSTDIASPNRIRCLAESLERNWRLLSTQTRKGEELQSAKHSRVCPYEWGQPVEKVLETLYNQSNVKQHEKGLRFDVICAADCCYLTQLHLQLLDSIDCLLSPSKGAVALLPFALHGNASDKEVWGIVEQAKARGSFDVDVLEPRQLTPPGLYMEAKRGLVHTIRLMRK